MHASAAAHPRNRATRNACNLAMRRTVFLLASWDGRAGSADAGGMGRLPPPPSWRDQLLTAVDVEGRAGDRRVRHEMNRERGDVGRADDSPDRQRRAQFLAA